MPIDPLPSISRSDANFRTQVDDYFLTRLPAFSTQAESARVQIVAAESTTTSAASAAATAATTATTAAGTATSASSAAVTAKNAAEIAAAQAVSGNVAMPIHAATAKTTPADADELGITDSAASWGLKKLTFTNLKAWLSGLFVSTTEAEVDGNLNFTGVARRITADFSNATASSRAAFQTSTVNGNTFVQFHPNGTGNASGVFVTTGSDGANYVSADIVATPAAAIVRSSRAGTGVAVPLELNIAAAKCMRLDSTTFDFTSVNGAIGYGPGAGGTVTQETSKSTGVTLNKPSGRITMNNASLNASASVSFVFNNSLLTGVDGLVLSVAAGATANSYVVQTGQIDAGLAVIHVRNVSGSNLPEAVSINFQIIKGAAS